MAEDQPEKSEKTEDPSEKRLDDAHRKGDVAKSQEVTTWFMILGSALVFSLLAPMTSASMLLQLKDVMAGAGQIEIGGAGFQSYVTELAGSLLAVALIPLGLMAVCAVAANLVQHKPVLSLDPIKPRLSKISPVQGFKRLFSVEALVNFAKGMAKLTIVGAVMFFVLWPERDRLDTMMTADPLIILGTFQELGLKIFAATLVVVTVIAIADFLYQRHRWWEKQKMTVREVRDEHRQMEGDPKIKSRIRAIRAERGRQRMMARVPEATVVITNPTHYAVALKYERSMRAPLCVAKGTEAVALRIREVAAGAEVPIVENPPLARALYASVEIDETIPAEHFRAVAQVIGYVMQLKSRRAWRAAT
jgi:flagellar biosynthetic protein FlhB